MAVLQTDTISLISRLKKSPFPIKLVHRVSNKTNINFWKIPDLNVNVFNIKQSKIDPRLLLAKNNRDKRFVKNSI